MKFETKTVNSYFHIFNKQDRFIEFISFPLEKPHLQVPIYENSTTLSQLQLSIIVI
jgi:hypothetical protein